MVWGARLMARHGKGSEAGVALPPFAGGGGQKKGKLTTSRRYNQVPLLRSSPGGFRGSMPCRTYPGAKVDIIFYFASVFLLLG